MDSLIANQFPNLPPAYLDTASVGLVPAVTGAALAEYADALSRGVLGTPLVARVSEDAYRALAEEFGTQPENISVLSSTGEALNSLARAFRLPAEAEVLVFSDDFPSIILPWTALDAPVVVRQIEPEADDERTEALISALGPRTRVVAVSHVHSASGTVVDLDRLAPAVREAGAILVVDGAQAGGLLPRGPADAYVVAGYKWLLSGFGSAVVITRPELLAEHRPSLLGHANRPPSQELRTGMPNYAALYALGASAELRQCIGTQRTLEHTHNLLQYAEREITALGFHVVGVARTRAGILGVAGLKAERLTAELRSRGIYTASRQGLLRISPYLYTNMGDIDDFLSAFAQLAPGYRDSQITGPTPW